MRIALLSDIHSNKYALKAVLRDIGDQVDRFWFLGDAVGYGPHPADPLVWIKENVDSGDWVLGNHDAILAGLLTPDEMELVHPPPKEAIEQNRRTLVENPEANAFWLQEFVQQRREVKLHTVDGVDYLLVHSRPNEPIYRYVLPWQIKFFIPTEFKRMHEEAIETGKPRMQCYGHSHIPTLVTGNASDDPNPVFIIPGQTYPLDANLALINPGSVGQPRDRDHRAAYAVLDTGGRTIVYHRVRYNWKKTASDMQMAGFPPSLVARLNDARPDEDTPAAWLDHFEKASKIAT